VDKHDEAIKALGDAGFATRLTDVAAVEIDDEPGCLLKVLEIFKKSQMNIEYLYAFLEGTPGKAAVVFKLENMTKGLKMMEENGLSIIEAIY
jgi:hypothetical protein